MENVSRLLSIAFDASFMLKGNDLFNVDDYFESFNEISSASCISYFNSFKFYPIPSSEFNTCSGVL